MPELSPARRPSRATRHRIRDGRHAQNPARGRQARRMIDEKTTSCGQRKRVAASCEHTEPQPIPPRGVEQTALTPAKTPISEAERTESGTIDAEKAPPDPDLTLITQCWPSLPKHVKAAVVTLIQSTTERGLAAVE